MKKRHAGRRLLRMMAALLTAMLLIGMMTVVGATELEVPDSATSKTASLVYYYAIPDAPFRVYYVGFHDSFDEIVLDGAFAEYPVNANEKTAPATLAAYAVADQITPNATGVTDANSVLKIDGLKEGVYLVAGEPKTVEGKTYTPAPYFATIRPDSNPEDPNAFIEGKVESDESGPTEIKVQKLWLGDEAVAASKRPGEISVSLYCNQELNDTVVLNAENSWSYLWKGLNPEAYYTLVENSVAEDYIVAIDRVSGDFVITNTYSPPSPPPSPTPTPSTTPTPTPSTTPTPTPSTTPTPTPSTTPTPTPSTTPTPTPSITPNPSPTPTPSTPPYIPRTGQLWWPVMLLAGAGLVLLCTGILLRKKRD